MTIALRLYQSQIVSAIREAFAEGIRAPLVVLPTGGGKTTIFGYVTSGAASKGRCIYLIAHRAELVKQIAMTLARFGTSHQIIAPGPIVRQVKVEQFKTLGRSFVEPSKVYVCSVQTLVKRLDDLPAPDIIVIDEAHHLTVDSQWGKVAGKHPKAKLLPVTATPIRLDGKGLGVGAGGFAERLIMGPTLAELIRDGYLSRYRIFAPPNALDLTGMKTRAGDYAKDALAKAMDKPTITGDAVQHYLRLASGRRAVAFCVSIGHAQHVAAEFDAAGVRAEVLDGSLDPTERERIIKRFEAGETKVLASCDVISEGFDVPAIEVAILLRPTQSLSLYLQQVGRALRAVYGPGFDLSTVEGRLAAIAAGPKPEALILDHVGAIVTHGLPDEDRDWTLDGITKKKRSKKDDDEEPEFKITTCPHCFTIHRAAPACPTCGHEYPIVERPAPVAAEGDLVELNSTQMDALKRARRAMQGKAQTLEDLKAQGISEFRAKKILEARNAKTAMVDAVLNGIERVQAITGQGPYATFGVTFGEIRRMKPKELKALQARVETRAAEITEQAA